METQAALMPRASRRSVFLSRTNTSHMDLSNLYVHDGRLLRVTEDTEQRTLTMEAMLPVSPMSDDLEPGCLVFEDIYGYQVFEGPISGTLTILDIKVVSKDGRWWLVRLETGAGHRQVFCKTVQLTRRKRDSGLGGQSA